MTSRVIGAETERHLRALAGPLRDQMRVQGLSQAQIARRVLCDRSRVSRALSGREVPSWDLVERIAGELAVEAAGLWQDWAAAICAQGRVGSRDTQGWPPEGLRTYDDLTSALAGLLAVRGVSQRELVRRDRTGTLRRSTVGAVLRGERSARLGAVTAIVRACGVSDVAERAWTDAWWRLGHGHRQVALQRRRDGYRRRPASWPW